MRSGAIPVLVVAAGVWLGGCAQGPSKAGAPEGDGGAYVAAGAGESVGVAASVKSGASEVVYRAMGEQQGALRVTRQEETVQPGERRRWSVTRVAEMSGQKPAERVVTMVELEDGSLAIAREENRVEKVIVDFDPPLLVYPASLKAGEPIEQKLRMIVHPMNNPARVQNQGDAKQTISYEGHERLQTPAGPLEAIKTLARLEADLGGPQVVNESQDWFAPGQGIVAMKETERTTLLGIRVRANDEWWVVERHD